MKVLLNLHKFIVGDEELRKAFFEEGKSEHSEFCVRKIIKEIVERYLYSTKASADPPKDIEKMLEPFVVRKADKVYF